MPFPINIPPRWGCCIHLRSCWDGGFGEEDLPIRRGDPAPTHNGGNFTHPYQSTSHLRIPTSLSWSYTVSGTGNLRYKFLFRRDKPPMPLFYCNRPFQHEPTLSNMEVIVPIAYYTAIGTPKSKCGNLKSNATPAVCSLNLPTDRPKHPARTAKSRICLKPLARLSASS